ncbi:MAG: alpha/beta fold hydrolase [Thermoleophilaceae bacterium]
MPGLLFSKTMHGPLAEALAQRGYRVLCLDLLGHGESDRPTEMWNYSMVEFRGPDAGPDGPPRHRAGRAGRHVAGRQHRAGGRGRRRLARAGNDRWRCRCWTTDCWAARSASRPCWCR